MTSFEAVLANNGFTKPQGSFEWQSGEIRAVVDDQSLQFRVDGGSYGELGLYRRDGKLYLEASEYLVPDLLERFGSNAEAIVDADI